MSVDGVWNLLVDSPMGRQQSKLEIRTEGGGVLVGTQSGQFGSNAITNGKVDGDNVSWCSTIATPAAITLEFGGVVAGDTLNGKVQAGALGAFDFTGARA